MRSDGQALYFLVVVAAIPLGLWTVSIVNAIGIGVGDALWLDKLSREFLGSYLVLDDKNVGAESRVLRCGAIAAVSVIAAPILAFLLNQPLVRCPALTARLLLRFGSVAELECFLWAITVRGLAAMVTTDSGKVYIGNSVEMPRPGHDKEFIRLEPLLSGYRDSTQQFHPTTSYLWVGSLQSGQNLLREDFDIVIPVDRVSSVHSFDLQTYASKYQPSAAASAAITVAPNQLASVPTSTFRSTLGGTSSTNTEWFYLIYILCVALLPVAYIFGVWWAASAIAFLALFFGWAATIE